MSATDLLVRSALVVVFVTAATSKLSGERPLDELHRTLVGFGLPRPLTGRLAAAAVIAAETCTAALVIAMPIAGYALALALFAAFTVGLARVVRSGRAVSCRCFGVSTTPIGVSHLVRNATLMAGSALGLVANLTAATTLDSDAWWLTIALGAALGAALTRWDDLAFVVGKPPPPRR